MASQLRQLTKMGGLQSMMQMLPGVPKIEEQMKKANIDDKMVKRQIAIIESMTPEERSKPELIKASRKQRIATGAGMSVQDVNKLLKQHAEASKMMKRMKKLGKKGMMRGGMPGMPGMGGGGLPPGFGGGGKR